MGSGRDPRGLESLVVLQDSLVVEGNGFWQGIQRKTAGLQRIVATHRGSIRTGGVDNGHGVKPGVPRGVRIHAEQGIERNVEPCLLTHLPDGGILGRLPLVDEASG